MQIVIKLIKNYKRDKETQVIKINKPKDMHKLAKSLVLLSSFFSFIIIKYKDREIRLERHSPFIIIRYKEKEEKINEKDISCLSKILFFLL